MRLKSLSFLLALSAIMISCGPSEGDIYENLLEGNRIKVLKIGNCAELETFYKDMNEKVLENSDESRKSLNDSGLYRPISDNFTIDNNSNIKCFSYEKKEAMRTEYGTISGTILIIDVISNLEEDYKKIN